MIVILIFVKCFDLEGKQMDKNKARRYLIIADALFLVFAIALFIFGATYAGGGFAKALILVAAVLVLVLAVEKMLALQM